MEEERTVKIPEEDRRKRQRLITLKTEIAMKRRKVNEFDETMGRKL